MEIFAPREDVIAVIRLHLERLPIMNEEERKAFLGITMMLAMPVYTVQPGDMTRPEYEKLADHLGSGRVIVMRP
mgnify:CR=1 FL=1